MTCIVKKVTSVEQHPDAEHLDVVLVNDAQLVSMKLENGSPRYKVDDLVVHIPHGSILPDDLLKRLDVWDNEKNKGMLSGSKGNKIKSSKFRGILSEGMLLPAIEVGNDNISEGDDVTEMLGVE